jgi:hypothetical protein
MKSSSTPERPGLARRMVRDARRLAGLNSVGRGDIVRAVWELARARTKLLAADATSWLFSEPSEERLDQQDIINRVAFAIPRAAARVPWRATCLVQALAAQSWLARMGIASELKLGARKVSGGRLDAHAWLEAGGRIVVGGDAEGYQPFNRNRLG